MHGFHEISGHRAWYTESGSHHVQVRLPPESDDDGPSVHRMVMFTHHLPFWARVKILLGWDPVVRYTALPGIRVEVGELAQPGWWPIEELAASEEAPSK